MNKIKYENIVESVDKHSCPGMFWCAVATTCYAEEKRRAICLDCWLKTMKERGVKVIYEGEYESEMPAQELFEQLGYVREDSEGVIAYKHYAANQNICIREIDFCFDFKGYSMTDRTGSLFIYAKLHEAITKQMKELGWLEE